MRRAEVLGKYYEMSNRLEGLLHYMEIKLICDCLKQIVEKEREIGEKEIILLPSLVRRKSDVESPRDNEGRTRKGRQVEMLVQLLGKHHHHTQHCLKGTDRKIRIWATEQSSHERRQNE